MNKTLLRDAAEYFHDREGRLLQREDAVAALAQAIDVDGPTAGHLVAGLTGDRVDPVVAVRTVRETFVGVLDFVEGDGWYGFLDYHDYHGRHRVGVCAQCVHEVTTDDDVFRTTTAEESWMPVSEDIERHYEQTHSTVNPDSVAVETGAILRSRTTAGGKRVWHTGNDGTASGFDARTVDGKTRTDLARGQLLYQWYDTSSRHSSNSHPTTKSGLDAYFDLDSSGVSAGGLGTHPGSLNWATSSDYPDRKPPYLPGDGYAWEAFGEIWIPEAGDYTFGLDADDATDLSIDGSVVVGWYDGHGTDGNYGHNGTVTLSRGWHSFRARYEEGTGGDGISVAWKQPGDSSYSVIPGTQFRIEPT
ncbi:PA14 domain-containing protein [Halorussus halophilus]|uniref:PA14 domain-containing protein n=1 Tax=Halorussus halophilus TaxID=2650975 RepID=UPI0013016684|nr:PA14 domain-containing protein [Halorussus halophilus]